MYIFNLSMRGFKLSLPGIFFAHSSVIQANEGKRIDARTVRLKLTLESTTYMVITCICATIIVCRNSVNKRTAIFHFCFLHCYTRSVSLIFM